MTDIGHEETEKLLKDLEKRITEEYRQAYKEVKAKFDDYARRFEIKDEIKRKAVENNDLSEEAYIAWRKDQLLNSDRWEQLVNELAEDYHNANEIALSTAEGYRPEAYAINHNYGTYLIENSAKVDTSYTLFDRQTVERLMREDPNLLPPPRPGGKTAKKLAENKDLIWNKRHISSAISQGVIQGEPIPKIAKRLEGVAQMDHNAAIRNARTMITAAQNAGRINASKRAKSMGVDTVNVWSATLDMRTRHEHRQADGQRKEPGEPFIIDGEEMMYPGDPSASAHLVYNCRCTLIPQVKGFEYDLHDSRTDYSQIDGMTYDEWQESLKERTNPITLPEEKAHNIKWAIIAEYKRLSGSSGGSAAQTKSVQNITDDTLNNILTNNYESHRIKNNLRSVAVDEITNKAEVISADLGKIDPQIKESISTSLKKLTTKYDSPVCTIRLPDKMELVAHKDSFAFSYHDYETDEATIVINPLKCSSATELRERLAYLKNVKYSANIPDTALDEYVITHEYAHTIFDFKTKLNKNRNWVNADYDVIKKARKEIGGIYDSYLQDVEKLSKAQKNLEFRYIMGDASVRDKFFEAKQAYDAVFIGNYSLKNADEFFAEAFTQYELGGPTNEYANQVHDVIVKLFGKGD